MDYIPLNSMKFYSECEPLVSGMGYILVELKVSPAKTTTKINVVIASQNPNVDIGVDDCAKVHRALLVRLEALLGHDDIYMELTSPGMERNIKNAAEFSVFKGKDVRVWDKTVSDWVGGTIVYADEKSVELESVQNGKITVLFDNIAKAKFIHS